MQPLLLAINESATNKKWLVIHLVQPRDWIFAKGYGFLSFAKNMSKTIGENISKNLSSKYSPSMLGAQMHTKLLQKEKF